MELIIDRNYAKKQTDRSWQLCIGSDHAKMLLRKDCQEQLKFIHDELLIKYVRFHGIFCDDMNVCRSFADGIPLPGAKKITERSFFHVGRVYDAVLEAGMKPFVELSFMPSQIASGRKTVFFYKGNITPPKSITLWKELIRDFIRFLLDRYGRDEIESWYFEVWNEPDLKMLFWSGTKEQYFELYKATVTTIKSIDDKIRVGGPATSNNRWITDFIKFCENEGLPYDFVSTHHYPGDAFGQKVDMRFIGRLMQTIRKCAGKDIGETNRALFYHPEIFSKIPKNSFHFETVKAKQEAGDNPLIYTEWNGLSCFGAPILDTKFNAAFILREILASDGLTDGYSFWCFSDLFEEQYLLDHPFNGGFGLLTVDGIPKPSFWAFKLLERLGKVRLDYHYYGDENVEADLFKKDDMLQIVLYRQQFVESSGIASVDLKIPQELVKSISHIRIDNSHCNPLGVWESMGSPRYLKKEETAWIISQSSLKEEVLDFSYCDGMAYMNINIAPNDIVLLEVNRR